MGIIPSLYPCRAWGGRTLRVVRKERLGKVTGVDRGDLEALNTPTKLRQVRPTLRGSSGKAVNAFLPQKKTIKRYKKGRSSSLQPSQVVRPEVGSWVKAKQKQLESYNNSAQSNHKKTIPYDSSYDQLGGRDPLFST